MQTRLTRNRALLFAVAGAAMMILPGMAAASGKHWGPPGVVVIAPDGYRVYDYGDHHRYRDRGHRNERRHDRHYGSRHRGPWRRHGHAGPRWRPHGYREQRIYRTHSPVPIYRGPVYYPAGPRFHSGFRVDGLRFQFGY